jgi:hypothetical protein
MREQYQQYQPAPLGGENVKMVERKRGNVKEKGTERRKNGK